MVKSWDCLKVMGWIFSKEKSDENYSGVTPLSPQTKRPSTKNAESLVFTGAPGKIRTCDLLIRSPFFMLSFKFPKMPLMLDTKGLHLYFDVIIFHLVPLKNPYNTLKSGDYVGTT